MASTEVNDLTCLSCGSDDLHRRATSLTLEVADRQFFFSGIPADICANCFAEYFDPETLDGVRKSVHSHTAVDSKNQYDWISFAA